jgi:hypothetical protein
VRLSPAQRGTRELARRQSETAMSAALDDILSLLAPGFLQETRENHHRRSAQEVRLAAVKATCAQKAHGTRARYVGGRCRCMLCRAANSRYQSGRAQAQANGEREPPRLNSFRSRAILWRRPSICRMMTTRSRLGMRWDAWT